MEICKYCNKTVTIKFDKKQRGSMSAHLGKCVAYEELKASILTKDYLYNCIEIDGMSMNEIRHANNFSTRTVQKYMKLHGFEMKSVKEAAFTQRAIIKRRETTLRNLGVVHNFCADSPSRIAMNQRLLEEEGITNVFQRTAVIDKIADTLAKRYADKNFRYGERISSIHKTIIDLLIGMDLSYNFNIEKRIANDSRFFYDIVFLEQKKIIEINGDFWHANPLKYKSTDTCNLWRFPDANAIWEHDNVKNEYARKMGYDLLIIWEHDIKKNMNSVVTQLKTFLEVT